MIVRERLIKFFEKGKRWAIVGRFSKRKGFIKGSLVLSLHTSFEAATKKTKTKEFKEWCWDYGKVSIYQIRENGTLFPYRRYS